MDYTDSAVDRIDLASFVAIEIRSRIRSALAETNECALCVQTGRGAYPPKTLRPVRKQKLVDQMWRVERVDPAGLPGAVGR
jgi:hypothetical protein